MLLAIGSVGNQLGWERPLLFVNARLVTIESDFALPGDQEQWYHVEWSHEW